MRGGGGDAADQQRRHQPDAGDRKAPGEGAGNADPDAVKTFDMVAIWLFEKPRPI